MDEDINIFSKDPDHIVGYTCTRSKFIGTQSIGRVKIQGKYKKTNNKFNFQVKYPEGEKVIKYHCKNCDDKITIKLRGKEGIKKNRMIKAVIALIFAIIGFIYVDTLGFLLLVIAFFMLIGVLFNKNSKWMSMSSGALSSHKFHFIKYDKMCYHNDCGEKCYKWFD